MKTIYTLMGFIVLLIFTPIESKIQPKVIVKKAITNSYYSKTIIDSKIDTLETTKHKVFELQKELGFNTN